MSKETYIHIKRERLYGAPKLSPYKVAGVGSHSTRGGESTLSLYRAFESLTPHDGEKWLSHTLQRPIECLNSWVTFRKSAFKLWGSFALVGSLTLQGGEDS